MMDRNSMATPMMTHLRKLCDKIDISFAESTLCQYMLVPIPYYWVTTQHVGTYVVQIDMINL